MKIFEDKLSVIVLVATTTMTIGIGTVFRNRESIISAFQKKEIQPVLELTDTEVELNVGDEFNAENYIKTATDSSGEDVTKDVGSALIDTSKQCEYEVVYTLVDDDKKLEESLSVKIVDRGK